jgi:molybdopterin synthase catalytic subunit
MRAKVLFFGVLKELVGRPSEEAEFPAGTTLGAVLEGYARRFPRLREMTGSIAAARNRQLEDLAAEVRDGDEVAFLPPVSGGTGAAPLVICDGGHYFALTRRSIDPRTITARLVAGPEGAVVTFEGTARNNTKGRRTRFLEYEGYEPMALQTMARIGREIAAARDICRIAMVHRLGRVLVGETSVAIMVTAPHRRPAFEAALEAIDRLKQSVPIWKKEYFEDGEVWAEGEAARDAR